jgi:antitoxin HicB
MVSLSYPVKLRPEAGGKGYVVRFPDLPEALTGGGDLCTALAEAADCLGEALACRMALNEVIPAPSKLGKAQHRIAVPLYLAPKVALYMAIRERGFSVRELAERLGSSEATVRRLLNPKIESKPETLQAALGALGKQILVAVDSAA